MRSTVLLALIIGAFIVAGGGARAQQSPAGASGPAAELFPREMFFGNPDRAAARISPDGSKLSYLASVDGVLNVWVGPVDDPSAAKPVTKDTKRGIRSYQWAYDGRHILYVQDKGGDENWHIYATDLASGTTKDLTPFDGVQARFQQVSYKFPNDILVGINDREAQLHDIYRVNLASGERKLVLKNDGYAGYVTDEDFRVRLGMKMDATGGSEYFRANDDASSWESFMKIASEDMQTTRPAGFDRSGNKLYLLDSRTRNTAALAEYDMTTGEQKIIAEDPRADVSGVMAHPTENRVEAVAFTYKRRHWQIRDGNLKKDFDYLKTVADGEFSVGSRSIDDRHWLVTYLMDDGPVRYYHYDREAKKATFLFTNRSSLEGKTLAKMHSVVIKARDGLNLVSYLSLPPWIDPDENGRPEAAAPMVLLVHGGPWARDRWGYNSLHQWLANRGYAVLSVNFRGSTGFGKSFLNAANMEWSKKMHDDLIDAVDWAINEKIADPKRVAIMGGSYGGYATLVGLTFTPKKFTCGVDIVGPSNLITLLNTIPPYWKPIVAMFTARVGDHRTEAGRKILTAASPLTHVDKIERPLLIGQGANDPRVKQSESDQIVKAMQEKKIPVTYVLFPDEGHGFRRPPNSKAFWAVTEAFLAKHLGGRCQPIGKDFEGSSIQVPTGANDIPALPAALPKKP